MKGIDFNQNQTFLLYFLFQDIPRLARLLEEYKIQHFYLEHQVNNDFRIYFLEKDRISIINLLEENKISHMKEGFPLDSYKGAYSFLTPLISLIIIVLIIALMLIFLL